MPTSEPVAESPLPPRVSWFAPWRWFAHWRPWKRWTLFVGVALLGYVLSPIVAVPVIRRTGVAGGTNPVLNVLAAVWMPLETADRRFPAVHWFYEGSFELVNSLLDPLLGPLPVPQRPPTPKVPRPNVPTLPDASALPAAPAQNVQQQ